MISKSSNLYDHVTDEQTDRRTDGQLPSAITRFAGLRAVKMARIGLVVYIVSFFGHCRVNFTMQYAPMNDDTTNVNANFYRAMHYSAKRSLAIACRLSV